MSNYLNISSFDNNIFGKPIRMAINDLMDFTYEYNNRTGNMVFRKNPFSGTEEGFYFDNLNRLATGVHFDESGNITWKEGVGHFTYHPTKVHAVESIYPPLTIGSDHDIYFTPFEKVSSILCHNTWIYTTFVYGPTHLRRQMTVLFEGHIFTRTYTQNVDISTIKSCCGLVFEETKEYIFSPFGLVAIRNNGRVNAVATDHLGSIVAEFNPNLGEFEFFGYTAWGRRYRYEQGHKHFFDSASADWAFVTDFWSYPESILDFFRRGFTGHEHLDLFGLINMNGRLYDPIIARFLSPDPFVQAPTFTQNFNRFSYAWNNPLRFIDPTGYFNQNIEDAINKINASWQARADWDAAANRARHGWSWQNEVAAIFEHCWIISAGWGVNWGNRTPRQIKARTPFSVGARALGIRNTRASLLNKATPDFIIRAIRAWFPGAPLENIVDILFPGIIRDRYGNLAAGSVRPDFEDGKFTGLSTMSLADIAFKNAKELFWTLGHELVHVSQVAALEGYRQNIWDANFRDMLDSHAFNFQYQLGWRTISPRVGYTGAWMVTFGNLFHGMCWKNFKWTHPHIRQ